MKQLIEDPQKIKLTEQDELQQILGDPPRILYRGTYIVFIIMGIVFLLSWMIKYPDVVLAEISITTDTPPVRLVAPSSGKIAALSVKENQDVKAGDILAIIENPTNETHVTQLLPFLTQISKLSSPQEALRINIPDTFQLEVVQQASFSSLVENLNNIRYTLNKQDAANRVRTKNQQIKDIETLNEFLKKEISILEKEVALLSSKMKRYEELFAKDTSVSQDEFEARKLETLRQERLLENKRSELINNNFRVNQLRLESIQLSQEENNKVESFLYSAREHANQLRSKLNTWQQSYIIKAPISGKVTLVNNWVENEYVEEKDKILTITPPNTSNKYLAWGNVLSVGAGKVEIADEVKVEINDYPDKEYGILEGKVKSIAATATRLDNGQFVYPIYIDLPKGLRTSYDSLLVFRPEMPGSARIITEDHNIMTRISYRLLNIFKN